MYKCKYIIYIFCKLFDKIFGFWFIELKRLFMHEYIVRYLVLMQKV